MNPRLIHLLIALLWVPLLAHAQAYKCRQANGAMSFQDQPCQTGTSGSAMPLPRGAGGEPVAAAADPRDTQKAPRIHPALRQSAQATEQDAERRRADEAIKAHNEQVMAYNKMQRCNFARQQLEVAQAGRPIFRRDNAGNRNYIEDSNRDAETAAAQRRVNAECL